MHNDARLVSLMHKTDSQAVLVRPAPGGHSQAVLVRPAPGDHSQAALVRFAPGSDAQAALARPAHGPDGTIAALGLARPSGLVGAPLARAALVGFVLAGAVGARWAATVGGSADGVTVGAAFGVLLFAGAAVVGWRPVFLSGGSLARAGGIGLAISLAIGLAGGTALLTLALATRWPGPWLPFHPAVSFLPWAAATVLVASAEEVVLRGALFDALDEAGGTLIALAATSVAFALWHVPLYGWHVVPLDLGVGLFLGGLRVLTGGVAAPAVAHVVADLATWWI